MVRYKELKRLCELEKGIALAHLSEALNKGDLKPQDFSIRELAEATIPDGREFVEQYCRPGDEHLVEAVGDAVDTSLFTNITGQLVFSAVREKYQAADFVATRLIPNQTVPGRLMKGEKVPGTTGLSEISEVVGEGEEYGFVGFSEDYIEYGAAAKRGKRLRITMEAVYLDSTGLILQTAGDIGEALGVNKEYRLIDAIIDLNSTAHRHKWQGTTYATYQTSTPWINKKTSNALVDWTDIDGAEQLFANMVNPFTGNPILLNANTILVCPELAATGKRILNATEIRFGDGASSTTQTVSANPVGPYRLEISKHLKKRLADGSGASTSWYLFDPSKAFVYREIKPLTVEQDTAGHSRFSRDILAEYKVSEFGAAATKEPRAAIWNAA